MAIYLIDDVGVLTGPVQCPVVPGLGIQPLGNSVVLDRVLPKPRQGHVWTWQDDGPKQQRDNRGTVYHTGTGAQQQWTLPGELPAIYTMLAWPGAHHIWREGQWQLDEQAKIASEALQAIKKRDELLMKAAIRIAPLQDAVELGIATAQEKLALKQWKAYRIALDRIEEQNGFPSSIEWPDQPQARQAR